MILHSSVERIGLGQAKFLRFEEERVWSGLLASLRYALPCPNCKKHYSDFYASHPIRDYSRESLRDWLFQLHQKINNEHGKPAPFTIEQLPEFYGKPFHYSSFLQTVQHHMKLAVFHRWCSREDVQRSLRFLEEIKRVYDFF